MRLALLLTFAVLAACSGKTDEPPSSFDGPTASGGTPPPSSSCKPIRGLPAQRLCVPGIAAPGAPIGLVIEDVECACQASTASSCSADVAGTTLKVSLDGQTCPAPADTTCAQVCAPKLFTCSVPALQPGSYLVLYGNQSHELEVGEGGVSSCALATPMNPDPKTFDTSCSTDSDCEMVSTDACSACSCPSATIAKSADAAYRAAFRAAQSQCVPTSANGLCGCPNIPVPRCDPGTKTCTVSP